MGVTMQAMGTGGRGEGDGENQHWEVCPSLEHCSLHIVGHLSHPQGSLLGLEQNMYKVPIFCH